MVMVIVVLVSLAYLFVFLSDDAQVSKKTAELLS